jgi:hypothetical protein
VSICTPARSEGRGRPHAQRPLQCLTVRGIVRAMKKQRFWDIDLFELLRLWTSDMGTFLMTFLMFVALSLPVVIPALIMWYLLSINWSLSP